MSTGADARTMPVTAEYEEGHARAFGEHRPQGVERKVYVMRCSACDGVEHAPDAKLYLCSKCKQWLCGSVDASIAPPMQAEARNAPIMVDRFMEGHVSQEGVDIGSRRKRKDYMRATGVTDASDYGPGYADRVKSAREAEMSKKTHETVARIAWTDPRWKP